MAWLTGWTYRKKITITGASGAGTNFQVLLKVGESSGASGADFHLENKSSNFPSAKNNGGDLRFTDSDETTLLDFWVEQVTGSSPNRVAYIWVEVADDLGSNQDIYCYFGNSSASSASNGANTFLFFDDFDGSYVDGSKWNKHDGTSASSVATNGDSTVTYSLMTNSYTISNGVIEALQYETNEYVDSQMWYRSQAANDNNSYVWVRRDRGDYSLHDSYFHKRVADNWGSSYKVASYSPTTSAWRIARVILSDSNFYVYVLNTSYSQEHSNSWSESTWSSGYIGFNHQFGSSSYSKTDWIRVRKYNATSPVFNSAGSLEKEIKSTASLQSTLEKVLKATASLYSLLEKYQVNTTALNTLLEKQGKSPVAFTSLLEKSQSVTTAIQTLLETLKKSNVALTSQLEGQLKSTTALWTELERILSGVDTVALYSLLEKLTYATVSLQTTLEKCKGETVALSTFLQYERTSPVALQSTLEKALQITASFQSTLEKVLTATVSFQSILEKAIENTVAMSSELEAKQFSATALLSVLERKQQSVVALLTQLEYARETTTALYSTLEATKLNTVALYTDLNYLRTVSVALTSWLEGVSKGTIALRTLFEKTTQSTTPLLSVLRPFKVKHELDNYDKHSGLLDNLTKHTTHIHNIKKL